MSPGSMLRHHHARWLSLADRPRGAIVVVALAVAIKLAFLILLAGKPPNVDGIYYLRASQEMMAGNMAESLRIWPMPAYPFLIGMVHFFVQDWLFAARLLSFAALTGVVLLLYRLTREIFGRRAAFWGCLAFALAPFPNEMTVLVYRGPVYVFVFLLAVWLMGRCFATPAVGRIFLAACVGVVAPLFRIEGVILVPLFLVGLLVSVAWRREAIRPVLGGIGAIVLLGSAAGAIFVLLGGAERIGAARFDEVLARGAGFAQAVTANHARITAGLGAIEADSLIPSQEGNFGEIAKRLYLPVYMLGLVLIVLKVLNASFIVPLGLGMKNGWPTPARWYAAVFAFYFLFLLGHMLAMDYSGARFAFAAALLLFPFVGVGIAHWIDWMGRSQRGGLWWLLFYLLILAMPVHGTLGKLETGDESAVAAGVWFGQSSFRGERIMGNDPRIPFAAQIPLHGSATQYAHYRPEGRDYSAMEQTAMEAGRKLVFLKLRKSRLERMPKFHFYREVKRFEDKEKIVFVFATPALADRIGASP